MKNLILISSCFFLFLSTVSAQILDGFDNILRAAPDDANILAEGYSKPLVKSISYGLSSGWATTAKTHKKFGFDITLGFANPSIPSADKKFNPEGLSSYIQSPNSLPTFFGSNEEQTLNYSFTGNLPGFGQVEVNEEVKFPGGVNDQLPLGLKTIPYPLVQASLGLFFDTDLVVRVVPKTNFEGSSFDLSGIAIKHNLMQYFGPLDKLPLNVSILFSIAKANLNYDLSESNFGGQDPGRKMEFETKSLSFQLLASLDIPIINLFAGIGFSSGNSSFDMLGSYNIDYSYASQTFYRPLENPISLSFDNSSFTSVIGTRFSIFPFLKMFANYTVQEYNVLSTGILFNFR